MAPLHSIGNILTQPGTSLSAAGTQPRRHDRRGFHRRAVARPPRSELSRRERQVLALLVTGRSEKQVALELEISPHTVHVYVKSLYKLFGVCSRTDLLVRWFTSCGEFGRGGAVATLSVEYLCVGC